MSRQATGLSAELPRKALHIGSGAFALVLRWIGPLEAALAAGVALLFNLLLLHRLSGHTLLRQHERSRGFSWGIALYPAVVLALVLVFSRRLELAAAVWGLLAIGDGMAAVVGLVAGGPRLPWNPTKRWLGLVAFTLWGTAASAFLLRWTQLGVLDGGGTGPSRIGASFLATSSADAWLPDPAFLLLGCFVAALAAALAESIDAGVDDNVVVPVAGGIVLWLATSVEPGRLAAAAPAWSVALVPALALNLALAAAAYFARTVSRSGAIVGLALGTALYTTGGAAAFLQLFLFFVLGSAATRIGLARKRALGIEEERGGRRGAANALANTTTGVSCAFLAGTTGRPSLALAALAGAFATAAFDTVSSEIGKVYGRRTVLVTSFRRVPPGTAGAVSLEGTLAGCAAAGLVAGVAWTTGQVPLVAAGLVVVAAFVGATVESYLGALTASGRRFENHLMNFVNTVVGAATAAALVAAVGLG